MISYTEPGLYFPNQSKEFYYLCKANLLSHFAFVFSDKQNFSILPFYKWHILFAFNILMIITNNRPTLDEHRSILLKKGCTKLDCLFVNLLQFTDFQSKALPVYLRTEHREYIVQSIKMVIINLPEHIPHLVVVQLNL